MRVKSFLFFLYILSAIMICFLPLYLDLRGFGKLEIGLAMGVALALGTIANLLVGMISDKWQKIRALFLILIGLQMLCALVMFSATDTLIIWVALQCFFIFYTPLTSLSDSLIMLVTAKNGHSYVSYRLWGSLGFAAGALLIGAWLEIAGLPAIWWIYGLCAVVTLLLAFPLPDRRGHETAVRFRQFGKLLGQRELYGFLIIIFVLALSHRMNDHYLGLFLQTLGAGETLIGWAWLASALSEIPVFLLLTKFGARFRPLPLLAFAASMYALRFLFMGWVDEPVMAVIIQCMHSITFGIFLYASITMLQTLIPETFRATGQAVFTITWVSLSGISASVIGGWVYEQWNVQVMYITASALALLAVIGFMMMHLMLQKRLPNTRA